MSVPHSSPSRTRILTSVPLPAPSEGRQRQRFDEASKTTRSGPAAARRSARPVRVPYRSNPGWYTTVARPRSASMRYTAPVTLSMTYGKPSGPWMIACTSTVAPAAEKSKRVIGAVVLTRKILFSVSVACARSGVICASGLPPASARLRLATAASSRLFTRAGSLTRRFACGSSASVMPISAFRSASRALAAALSSGVDPLKTSAVAPPTPATNTAARRIVAARRRRAR